MELSFACPKCKTNLNPNIRVILVARRDNVQGLMLLSPRVGDYDFKCDKKLNGVIQNGDVVEFCCPVCQASLTSAKDENFAELLATDMSAAEPTIKVVRFSCICNEHATFVYDKDSVKAFGEDTERYYESMRIDGDWGW